MLSVRYLFGISLYLVAAHTLVAQDSVSVRHDTLDSHGAQPLKRISVRAQGERRTGYRANRILSATKTDSPLRDVPQSVTVVSHALIADQAMQGMAEVVRYVPGITMGQGEGHRDAPTIRGQSTTADFYVDGTRDDAQYLRDLYNVERVEALKGSNAMMFGRGGGGGVINRVSKAPSWSRVAELAFEAGSFDHKRSTLDLGGPVGDRLATRLNAMYENSAGFRHAMRVQRLGINPEATIALGSTSTVRVGVEHFSDARTVDRGIPSFQGRPAPGDVRLFFGDPDASRSRARTDAAHVDLSLESDGGLTLRSRTAAATYDKYYQNVYAGSAVSTDGARLNLAAYNSTVGRRNIFNQTDLSGHASTGAVRHTLLVGSETGSQGTDNFRNTGYFNNTATSSPVPTLQPTVGAPVTYRQSASDADNHVVATVLAGYVQDQVAIGEHLQAIAGVRVDRMAVRFHNNRVGASAPDLARVDWLLSPRIGVIVKPIDVVSLYAAQGVSHLPSSGDQFSSLTVTTQTLEPELFTNRELGAKWDVGRDLALTAAIYRLERSNSVAPDPADPSRVVQTGRQRSDGIELGASGNITPRWQLAGVTGSGFIVLASTLAAMRVVPVEGVAILLGVDRFMSEARAITNLIGNGAATLVIARSENAFDETARVVAVAELSAERAAGVA